MIHGYICMVLKPFLTVISLFIFTFYTEQSNKPKEQFSKRGQSHAQTENQTVKAISTTLTVVSSPEGRGTWA